MPAFRGKNLRSGDIIEEFTLLLFKKLALVTPIPRTEDVGIDALVTLLTDYDAYRFIAKESFFLQTKSSSIDKIIYKKDQVLWLFELDLPFFIASFEKQEQKVKLYCLHRLNDAYITNKVRSEIQIVFEEYDPHDYFVDKDSSFIQTGKPILEFTLDSLEKNKDYYKEFNSIVKEHLILTKEAIELRKINRANIIVWETNYIPYTAGSKSIGSNNHEETLNYIFEKSALYVTKLSEESLFTRDNTNLKQIAELCNHTLEALEKMTK